MDVNGTRFHLLLGAADWGAAEGSSADGLPDGIGWNREARALQLAALPFIFPPRTQETPPGDAARRGAGRDRFGNWYWIDPDSTAILARAPGGSAPRRFWPAPSDPRSGAAHVPVGEFTLHEPAAVPPPRTLSGLAVTAEHYLVVGALAPAGLLLFDLAAGGPPVALAWPETVPFHPWDVAACPDGGVWVLDRVNGRLWSLDRWFRVRAPSLPLPVAPPVPEFEPVASGTASGGGGAPRPGATAAGPRAPDCWDGTRAGLGPEPPSDPIRPVTLGASRDVGGVPGLVAVESFSDGSALLLGEDGSGGGPAIHRFTQEGAAGVYALAPLLEDHEAAAEQLPRAHDLAWVHGSEPEPGRYTGTLFLVAPNGNQAFAFGARGAPDALELGFQEAFYPMRRFGGRALVSAGGAAHYDSGERWVSLLEQPRPRYESEAEATLPPTRPGEERGVFDGREPGCVWHRLFLDACIPPGSSVVVESRAADTLQAVAAAAWREEPDPRLRGPSTELPWTPSRAPEGAAGAGTWELLFQAARGRFMQLRLRLRGNGRTTPRVHALRVYYPRFSYLEEYLPAVYREDPGSASFLDRYLANPEGLFTELEGRIAAAQLLFDTRTVPVEFLDWLAGWLGASLDAAWNEEKRRFFLAHALRMFAGRGTRDGMVRALRLALESCPDPDLFEPLEASSPQFSVRIVEKFLSRSPPGVEYGDAGDARAPGTAPVDAAWSPAQGADPLHEAWRDWLAGEYTDVAALNDAWGTDHSGFGDPALTLVPTAPADPAPAADWRRFVGHGLPFTYEAPEPSDLGLWQDFLERRYRQPGDLDRAWLRYGSARTPSFESVPYPDVMPAAGAELSDWITFVAVVLPLRRGAHQFTVLVPVGLDAPPEEQRARRDLVARLADLEKPAHTVVRTRLYWAAFQVGEARLGSDSVLGKGSRFSTRVLGGGELAAAHLGWQEPWNVRGRRVVGRDVVAIRSRNERSPTRCS
jgi:phage tail-like protein